jgi:transposase
MGYLTVTESVRHAVILQYLEGKLPLGEACRRLSIHRSTFWRSLHRFQEEGPLGLAHKLRGRPSNFAEDLKIKQAIVKLYAKEYAPFGFRVAHFYQEALKDFPKPISYPTVLRWLKELKLVEQSRKGWKHHSRRPRREAFGELIQMDTSIHDWLGWGKNLALISNMDDCTNVLCGAYLTFTDTTLGNMTVLKQTIQTYGLFASLYVDRAPVFKVTRTGQGGILKPTYKASYFTQIQRALEELGIEMIYAYSPQAKGRIERSFGTWQSRLIPELKKNGIRDLDKANAYIHEIFIPKHNARFAQDPKAFPSAFVPLFSIDLNSILAEKYQLTVSNDHIVSSKHAQLALKILPSPHRRSYAKAKVEVLKHTDGNITVLYKDEPLNFTPYRL